MTAFDFDAEITESITLYAKWAFVLTEDEWTDGEITDTVAELWYAFAVEAGTTYHVWWNGLLNGDGSKTLYESASAWHADGAEIFIDANSAFNTPRNFTPTSSGAVYVRVIPNSSGSRGTFAVTYSAGSARPAVPFVLPSDAASLTEDAWTDGEIVQGGTALWYSFPVDAGETYNVWWNAASGDGSKTLQARASAWHEDGREIFFDVASGYAAPRTFTPISGGMVYVRMLSNFIGSRGTFAVAYSSGATRPSIPVDLPSDDASPLTEDQWMDGAITDEETELWYSFPVEAGQEYRLWLHDRSDGDGSKTLSARASAWYADETEIFSAINNAFNTPQTFTPALSGTVYVRVFPSSSVGRGTFALAYSSGTARPAVPFVIPADATSLTEDEWMDGEITDTETELWYSFRVTANENYNVWWNDAWDGNGSKTLEASASAWHEDGTEMFIGHGVAGFSWPLDFKPSTDGMVYVRILPLNSGGAGTFAIAYSSGDTRPAAPIDRPSIPLTENQWMDGEITDAESEQWYSFQVVAGQTYRLWWNDGAEGDGSKNLQTVASAWHADGTPFFTYYFRGYNSPRVIRPASDGTVYVRMTPRFGIGLGTFGLVYSSGSTRPQ
ncbi:MAG: hypothetical protein FWE09_09375 [Treponema sp.]|nr:hypothetical protein [Treponema sp.]